MHVFLTGNPHIGKKTVISTIATRYELDEIGGFVSYFGLDNDRDIKSLYMTAANSQQICDDEHAVAYFFAKGLFRTLTDRFDDNAKLLVPTEKTKIIIMNECSYLESDAKIFQKAVLDTLDGDIPVLGVFKTIKNTWTRNIINHPNVTIIDTNLTDKDFIIEKIDSVLGK